MKKNVVPPELTKEEHAQLNCYFFLEDWHFDTLFIKNEHITKIDEITINYEPFKQVQIYGLKAVIKETGQSCIANFFLRADGEVYQSKALEGLIYIVGLLRKWEEIINYQRKQDEKKLKAVA